MKCIKCNADACVMVGSRGIYFGYCHEHYAKDVSNDF